MISAVCLEYAGGAARLQGVAGLCGHRSGCLPCHLPDTLRQSVSMQMGAALCCWCMLSWYCLAIDTQTRTHRKAWTWAAWTWNRQMGPSRFPLLTHCLHRPVLDCHSNHDTCISLDIHRETLHVWSLVDALREAQPGEQSAAVLPTGGIKWGRRGRQGTLSDEYCTFELN